MANSFEEQINTNVFPKAVTEQAAVAAKIKPSAYLPKRLDLRGKTILSFGDSVNGFSECALSLYKTAQGWQLGVHVADVAEYVCEGSPLDTEARRRRASVHNGFATANMLPESVTRDMCNLAPQGDKLALSVLLDIDTKGQLISVKFEESVIQVAARCIYRELDEYGLAQDASSVMMLRDKYLPYTGILADMYELAAMFCNKRLEKGALDCPVFVRNFKRNEEGKAISFSLISEPDSRAMVREIGYFAAEAIGNYMYKNQLPCIFVGQETLDCTAISYLRKLLGIEALDCDDNTITSEIISRAKGSPYYDFVCDALSLGMPCPQFSTSPIYNAHCASDKVVSFVRPATRYADLLTQRAIKTTIAASGSAKNININRQRAIINAAAEEANNAEKFVYSSRRRFYNLTAREYLENCGEHVFNGFPLLRDESGAIPVLLCCGAQAIIPSEYANITFEAGKIAEFEIIAIGTEEEPTIVKPIN